MIFPYFRLVRLVRLAFIGSGLIKFRNKVQFRPALPEVTVPTPATEGITTATAPATVFDNGEHMGEAYDVQLNKKNH